MLAALMNLGFAGGTATEQAGAAIIQRPQPTRRTTIHYRYGYRFIEAWTSLLTSLFR